MVTVTKCILAKRPKTEGGIVSESCFELITDEIPNKPRSGKVLIEVVYASVEPAMRSWMSIDTYIPKVKLGKPMRAMGAGRIIAMADDVTGWSIGDWVTAGTNVQTHVLMNAKYLQKLPEGVDPRLALSVLGTTGQTAYWGLFDIGKPKPKDTVLVSGAAGGVGAIVCQLAKLHGCRVVGIVGSDDKCKYMVEELGVDAAINHRKVKSWKKALKEKCPKGVDVFFDNVGGQILEAAIGAINFKGRIVICGAISQYGKSYKNIWAPKTYLNLITMRAKMEGFVVIDYFGRVKEMLADIEPHLKSNRLKQEFTVVNGVQNFVPCYNKLFTGDKKGKLFLKVNSSAKL